MISIEIEGRPIPKARPRFARYRCYDPQMPLKESVCWQIKNQFDAKPLEGPLTLNLQFELPIPKSYSKKKREQIYLGDVKHDKKPDLDNLVKFVTDCMNGLVYRDDSQIAAIYCTKNYSNHPKTRIVLEKL